MALILQGQFIWNTAIQRVYKVAANSVPRPYGAYGFKLTSLYTNALRMKFFDIEREKSSLLRNIS
jgi:hypothetical protein